jgi:MerC mercury resistance protein
VNRPNVDQLGSVASFACAVHCALTGLALGVLSSAGLGFIGNHSLEVFFIGSTIALGIWAVINGFRVHHQWHPALLFGCGLTMIYLAHAIEPGWIFSVLGGAFLITFHWVNQKKMRQCRA